MTEHYDWTARGANLDTAYTQCPTCTLVGASTSGTYARTADGRIDPRRPVEVTCEPGQHRYTITTDQILPRDATVTCVRKPDSLKPEGCANTITAPAIADTVCCPACGLYQYGPAAPAGSDRRRRVDAQRAAFGQFAAAYVAGHRSGR